MRDRKIDYQKYSTQLIKLNQFCRYIEIIITETNVASKLKDFEFDWMLSSISQYLRDQTPKEKNKFTTNMNTQYEEYIKRILGDGLSSVRSNLFVSAYSIFEFYLLHLVEVYCLYFPVLYSNYKIEIQSKELNGVKTGEQIQDIIREKFINTYSFWPFERKLKFIKKDMKLNDSDIWLLNGKDSILEINRIRNKIVHSDEHVDIDYEYIKTKMEYLGSVIFKLAAYSQYKHGIEFIWIGDSNINIKQADRPTL